MSDVVQALAVEDSRCRNAVVDARDRVVEEGDAVEPVEVRVVEVGQVVDARGRRPWNARLRLAGLLVLLYGSYSLDRRLQA
jgi:hypothetical protein